MNKQKITLTGITPSGTPHIGNYIGAIKPALDAQGDGEAHYYFIADLHSLIKQWDPKLRQQNVLEVAATWMALGLDLDKTIFYCQSDIPEISELNWILGSLAAKGLLNRAHAYKDKVAQNETDGEDPDHGITMGLYCYPVLMTADILAFNATHVPVGKDQIQHLEIARDIANRFNHVYADVFALPEAVVDKKAQVIPGLDGRKMSKSYGNTIPLFETSKKLRKSIMKIVTNSQPPEEPKDWQACTVFNIYQSVATPDEIAALKQRYEAGIGWGDAKQTLFEKLDSLLAGPRERYNELINSPAPVHEALQQGAEKARKIAAETLKAAKIAAGLHVSVS
jgi:tryptophanyl-tRNA synthetase